MRPAAPYLDRLLLYYEEEIEGEAYFHALAEVFADPDHSDKLTLLAEVERHTALGVAPLVAKYSLVPRARTVLARSGRAQAGAAAVSWPDLIADMVRTYPGYISAFRALEDIAPAEDRPRLAFLTAHEEAAMAFLALEPGAPGQSAGPLRAFLRSAPGGPSPGQRA